MTASCRLRPSAVTMMFIAWCYRVSALNNPAAAMARFGLLFKAAGLMLRRSGRRSMSCLESFAFLLLLLLQRLPLKLFASLS